jgi:hypothetical protein
LLYHGGFSAYSGQPRTDLIAFDSSFTKADIHGTEFERLWNCIEDPIYSARGWCDASVEKVVTALEKWDGQDVNVIPANIPPFIGMFFSSPCSWLIFELVDEVKIVIMSKEDKAVMRLGKSEDESCLWRVRSRNYELRTGVENILKAIR